MLSVFDKTVDNIIGWEENVHIPLNVLVEVTDPNVIDPVVKLEPINIEEFTDEAFIIFTSAVDIFKLDIFATEKD